MMSDEALTCFTDAKDTAEVLACSRAQATATITVSPGGAAAGRADRCAKAEANVVKVQVAGIEGARDAQIATCQADQGRAVECELAAETAQAWAACAGFAAK
jgi:hypothetical protein